MNSKILAWHFLPDDGRLANGDGRKPQVGKTLVYDGAIELCKSGFHASIRAIDALRYTPGALVCRVESGGNIILGDDKLVSSERTILWQADATNTLHEFSCRCAEDVLHFIPEVHRPIFAAALAAKRGWLRGDVTDNELDAARTAAWTAAGDAAWDAAGDAAWDAAWDAAGAAAWDAARAAARAAAGDAARDAVRAAAGDAARDAARAAQNARLEMMLLELAPKDVAR